MNHTKYDHIICRGFVYETFVIFYSINFIEILIKECLLIV